MENFLSFIILILIVIYLTYEFLQKRGKSKQNENGIDSQVKGEAKEKNVDEKDKNHIEEKKENQFDPNAPKHSNPAEEESIETEREINLEEYDDLEFKIRKIDEIVEKGLFGGMDKEHCLNEIKKILTNQ